MKGQESFPQSMSEDQLARIRIEAMWKEIEATAVWLNCPTLSVEEGRELGADWSVVSERFKRFLKDEKKVRAWAVAEVGKEPRIQTRGLTTCIRRGGRLYASCTRPSEKSTRRWTTRIRRTGSVRI